MSDVTLFGLFSFVAGLGGGGCVAAIFWKLSVRRHRELVATLANARDIDREMLARWQRQQQDALNTFQATQLGVLGECLAKMLDARGQVDTTRTAAARPSTTRVAPAAVRSGIGLHDASRPASASPLESQTGAAAVSRARPNSEPSAPRSPALSARPPELLLTPMPRAELVKIEEAAARELSDAEIDALPPELPEFAAPRRRVLPTPKSPVMRPL